MFELVSDETRLETLLKIVRNLITHSRNAEIFRLTEILSENNIKVDISEALDKNLLGATSEEVKASFKKKIKEEVKEKLSVPKNSEIQREHLREENFIPGRPIRDFSAAVSRKPANFQVQRVLRIPKVVFPPYLSNIKPVATSKVSIDLGQLNPFVEDPNVLGIETEGENEPVYVTGTMGRKPTNLRLSKKEINEVISRFSEISKIPKSNGMFRVAVGKLLLTAMISDSVSSRFVIEKIKSNPLPPGSRRVA